MVKVSISCLEPDALYAVVMDIVPVGDNRYKFHDSEWVVTGKAEPMGSEKGRLFVHPDSPATGASWEKQIITFQKCKITNNHLDQLGYVSCTSDLKSHAERIVQGISIFVYITWFSLYATQTHTCSVVEGILKGTVWCTL